MLNEPLLLFLGYNKWNAKAIFSGIICALILSTSLIPLPGKTASALNESPWMPDERIPGYFDETFTPFLLADQYGNVHAFASQSLGDGFTLGIVYRKWSLKQGWTTPVDVLLSPYGDAASPSAFLDSGGILHLLFYGGDERGGSIYYSQVPVENAGSTQAWSAPTIIGDNAVGPPYTVLTGDDAGNLTMIYTGNIDGGGVYSAFSSDSGLTWSRPEPVYLVDDVELIPFSLRLYEGRDRQVHAIWNIVTMLGTDVSLHYARFDFETFQWTSPVALNRRTNLNDDSFGPSYPSLVDTGNEVVVMYNNGNPLPTHRAGLGRPVQMVSVSNDNGNTWEPPLVPYIKHEGRSGEHVIVQDSDHVVHALFVQRTAGDDEVLGGIWQSDYQNGYWSDPYRFIPTYPAHDLRAVVIQGNTLLMVWRMDPGNGKKGIWYTYKTLDSKPLPVLPYPTRQSGLSSQADLTAPVLVPLVTRTPIPAELLGRPLIGVNNPGSSLGFGIITVTVILVIMLITFGITKNRQS